MNCEIFIRFSHDSRRSVKVYKSGLEKSTKLTIYISGKIVHNSRIMIKSTCS